MSEASRKEILKVSLAEFYSAVTDFVHYPDFVTGMKSAKLVEETAAYKIVDFKVEMMKSVEYRVKIEQLLDEAKGTGRVHWDLVESSLLTQNSGTWDLKSLGPNEIEVNYSLAVGFDFPVPGFILKGLVANSLPKAIREFYDRAVAKGKKS